MRHERFDQGPYCRNLEAWGGRTNVRHQRTFSWTGTTRAPGCREEQDRRVTVYRRIADIDPVCWDEVAGTAAVARSHAYLSALEAAGINDLSFFYPVIRDTAGRILAHACVYTITTDFAQMLPRPLRGFIAALRRLWPSLLKVKVTECAAPLIAGQHSISIRRGIDAVPLVRDLGRAVGDIARSQRSRLLVIRDFLDADRPNFDVLLEEGYNLTSNMPLSRIRVRWTSYDDYLQSMRSRYRKDLKRRLDKVEQSGQQVLRVPGYGMQGELWAAQVRAMYEKTRGFKRETLGPEYYAQLERGLGERSLLLATARDGRLSAHGLVLFDELHTIATYFGREPGPPGNEWFHLLNEVIRIGIERGHGYICLGLGSYDAKSLLGADIEPLHVYCRSTLAPVNWLMRCIPHTMAAQPCKQRRIFHDGEPPAEDAGARRTLHQSHAPPTRPVSNR